MSTTAFNFTKLLVNDLDKTADFYKAVVGFTEMVRVEDAIAGRPISEVIFNALTPGGPTFVLLKFLDSQATAQSEVILGLTTSDVDGLVSRAEANGGKIISPPTDMPAHGVRVAFITDPEGHMLEVVQLLAQPQG